MKLREAGRTEFPYLVSFEWWGARRDKVGSVLMGDLQRAGNFTKEKAERFIAAASGKWEMEP